jgi:DNA-binding transcriptional ArsR family regulator
MPETVTATRSKPESTASRRPDVATGESIDPDELLAVLGDDYARRIVAALGDESLPARAIVDRLDASRPTVYRRLNRLEDAGVVASAMDYDPDGHHRRRFRVALDGLTLSFDDGRVALESTR